MAKDPAVLLYINDWLISTAEMDADCRGWYLSLLLHNYDKGDLPNDVEKLASLCNVKFSEFKRFEQVFEQVFKQKFEQVNEQRISNPRTNEILRKRNDFKSERSGAGKMSYLIRFFKSNFPEQYKNIGLVNFVKEKFDFSIDMKNEQMFKQVFKHLFELYINENENENKDININKNKEKKENFKIPDFEEFLSHAIEKKPLIDSFSVRSKYESWVENGWKDGNDRKITNWKIKLNNTLPYLKENTLVTKTQKQDELIKLTTELRNSIPNL